MKYPSQTKTRIVKDAELQNFLRVLVDTGENVERCCQTYASITYNKGTIIIAIYTIHSDLHCLLINALL